MSGSAKVSIEDHLRGYILFPAPFVYLRERDVSDLDSSFIWTICVIRHLKTVCKLFCDFREFITLYLLLEFQSEEPLVSSMRPPCSQSIEGTLFGEAKANGGPA